MTIILPGWPRRSWLLSALTAAVIASVFAALPKSSRQYELPPHTLPIGFQRIEAQGSGSASFLVRAGSGSALLSREAIWFDSGGARVRMTLAGAAGSGPECEDVLPYLVHNLTGAERDWRRDQTVCAKVRYRDALPGIDMVYGVTGRTVKSDFVVRANAEPGRIRMRYPDAESVTVNAAGELVVKAAGGELRERPPDAWQDGAAVPVRFVLTGDREAGFELGPYDRRRELVIDPEVVFSTYHGGSGTENATALAVDRDGGVVMVGWTDSPNLPLPWVYPYRGSVDAFIVRFAPGGAPASLSYIGGSGDDRAAAVSIDSLGNAWITGSTTSRNFPVVNAFQPRRLGTRDAFVTMLEPDGRDIGFSSYLGGSLLDWGTAIRVDPTDAIVVAGETDSPNFPQATPLIGYKMLRDGFVARLSREGRILNTTYLGGNGDDRVTSVAADTTSVVVGGCTSSGTFPVKAAAQPALSGGRNGFVSRFDPNLNTLHFSTYHGGSGGSTAAGECVNAVAVDVAGNVHAAGATSSSNMPTLNAAQSAYRGGRDAFAAKFTAAGARVFSTYLGGSGIDQAYAIAVDAAQRPWIAGSATSAAFPPGSAVQAAPGGSYDAFLLRLESSGAIGYSTRLGGSGADQALAVTLSGAHVYVAGSTGSTNFPLRNAYLGASRGGIDSFLVKLTAE